jgi:TonB family protein
MSSCVDRRLAMTQGFGKVWRALLAFVVFSVAATAQQQEETVYYVGNGVSEPVMIQTVQPGYTQEARDARVTGTVELQAVIGTDGSVAKVQVTKGLGYGLDENAAKALAQWRFRPGTKDGKPVNVRIEIKMNFSLR